jgi:hypothetical protein
MKNAYFVLFFLIMIHPLKAEEEKNQCQEKYKLCWNQWQQLEKQGATKENCDACINKYCSDAQNQCKVDLEKNRTTLQAVNAYLLGCKKSCKGILPSL